MTHPASIFPISALAVSAILLLSGCSHDSITANPTELSGKKSDRLVTNSVAALIAQTTSGIDQSDKLIIQKRLP